MGARLIAYTKSPEQKIRLQAISALTIVGSRVKTVVPALIKLLDDGDPAVVIATCAGLAALHDGAKPAVKDLIKLLDHKEMAVVGAACAALGALGDVGKPAAERIGKLMENTTDKALKAIAEAALKNIHAKVEK